MRASSPKDTGRHSAPTRQPASPSRPMNGSTASRRRRGGGGDRNVRDLRGHTRDGGESDLGWNWKSQAGLPIVCVPGCPVQPDNFTETLLYLLYQAAGLSPMIPLDDALRPTWLFGQTVHEGCDRAGYYEQGDFAEEYGSPKCIVKLGCWGPVVQCNVPKRGWMAGIGGCPNVGGICIGCTMPGFPDKFMPFMDEPPGAKFSSVAVRTYGIAIRTLRKFTKDTLNKEPSWRHTGTQLTTGYKPVRH